MSSVFYRNPQQEYPRGLRGEGVYLYDTEGKQSLDGSGGAAVSCLGHWHPYVIAAIKRQVEELAYAHTAFFTNDPQERLAKHLSARFGEEGARVEADVAGAASTWAVGQVFTQHFETGGTFLTFDPERMKAHYAELLSAKAIESKRRAETPVEGPRRP